MNSKALMWLQELSKLCPPSNFSWRERSTLHEYTSPAITDSVIPLASEVACTSVITGGSVAVEYINY